MAAIRARCTSMACVRLLRVEQVMLYVTSLSLLLLLVLGFTAARLFEVSTNPVTQHDTQQETLWVADITFFATGAFESLLQGCWLPPLTLHTRKVYSTNWCHAAFWACSLFKASVLSP